ncbi:MAG: hypothetical protein EPN85_10530 [Bacteroidetes bacterium]|nr:MAG: hypothetical protein EPN85_10530 [Bacteroidota bacterium]
MKRHILLLVTIFSTLSVWADNILLLTNTKSQETKVFRKGSFIVFELKKDNTIREGFIRDIRESSLSFEDLLFERQVSLSEINILAGSTKSRVAARRAVHAVGNAILYTGLTAFDCGLDLMFYNSDYYYWPLGGTIWAAGAVIAGLGYAFDWALCPPENSVRIRNYRQWNASIVAEGQQIITEKQKVQAPDSTQTTPVPVKPEKEKRKKSKITEDDVYGN